MLNNAAFAAAHLTPDVAQAVILNQMADETPLVTTLLTLGQVDVTDAERFQWGTDAHPSRRTQIDNGGAAYDAATTSLDVDTSAPFYVDCLVLAEATGELLLVTAITDANTIVVKRGVGGSVAAHANSVANDAFLSVIGPALGEGSSRPAARQNAASNAYNHVQTVRTPFGITGRAHRTKKLTGSELLRQRAKKFQEHMRDIERMFLFGGIDGGALTDSAGRRLTLTQGLRQAITTNVDTVGGTMTKKRFFTFCEIAFRRKSKILLMCGPVLMQTVHELFDGAYRIVASETVAGLMLTKVKTPFGEADLALNRTMTGPYAGDGFGLSLPELRIRHTEAPSVEGVPVDTGRTHLRQNIEDKGTDGHIDEYFTEEGLEWGGEFEHSQLRGVTGSA